MIRWVVPTAQQCGIPQALGSGFPDRLVYSHRRWCMRSLRVTILDLVTKGPTQSLYTRVMNPNLASIMPQVIGVWCEALGHQVRLVCYTGREDLHQELLNETDLVFIGAF